jgi:hypothetical protein
VKVAKGRETYHFYEIDTFVSYYREFCLSAPRYILSIFVTY